MKNLILLLLLACFLSLSSTACDSSSETSDPDGDTLENDDDKEQDSELTEDLDSDLSLDGDKTPDGDIAPEGDNVPADGDMEENSDADGDSSDGDLASDGDVSQESDNVADGDTITDGDVAPDGDDDGDTISDGDVSPDGDDIADGDLAPDGDEFVPDGDVQPDGDAIESESDGETGLAWEHWDVTLVDAVQTGDTIRCPIDTIEYAISPKLGIIVTDFEWDINDNTPYVWQVDMANSTHSRVFLTGTAFSLGENFCNGEDWCQFIGYDPTNEEFVVTGPRASAIMRIDKEFNASLTATSGTQPSNGAISYSKVFDWNSRKLYVYGYLVSTGAGSRLYALDLDSGAWTMVSDEMTPVESNCLVYVGLSQRLYSFGGQTDGSGEDSAPFSFYGHINPQNGDSNWDALPKALTNRQNMACAYDAGRSRIYLFGGSEVNDYFDETLNVYHNDLWAFDLSDSSWKQLLADTESGTFTEDQRFEGYPDGPNFGMNRPTMRYHDELDELFVLGDVPRFTHEQFYRLKLSALQGKK